MIKMMAAQTFFFLLLYSSLLIAASLQTSVAYCPPSSCGIIPNISYPFRLNTDPKHCGGAELVCENNVTFLYLHSHKYYVKAINYTRSIYLFYPNIRLVDASININHTCSFLNYSAFLNIFTLAALPYRFSPNFYGPTPINLMSCPEQLKNVYPFTDISHCNSSSNYRFSYIKIGRMKASDVRETCSVDMIVPTSFEFKNLNNVSLEEIHRSLLYGFQLIFCTHCRTTSWEKFISYYDKSLIWLFRITLIIVVLSGAVVNPVITIIGLAFFLFSIAIDLYDAGEYNLISNVVIIVGGLGARFIISLFLAWVFISKFRRRHLSRFDAIERFLQSDNQLAPIRYFYSDIKKMTKNFQDKLGEGGYGSVYKGKLRSGHYVAVKILENLQQMTKPL